MKLILSRKGFDSASGKFPNPILPDGRLIPLPIPDKNSNIQYKDIHYKGFDITNLQSLTKGKVLSNWGAHLDPDLNDFSISRKKGWRPVFGQSGSAQGHLRNNSIEEGDLFLFFGLFQKTKYVENELQWDKTCRPCHLIWGWLQIGEIVKIDKCNRTEYSWANYHPHFNRNKDINNTLYISKQNLNLPGQNNAEINGAGIFPYYNQNAQLSDCLGGSECEWKLPKWFYPIKNKREPLTYHKRIERWQLGNDCVYLNSAARGQEFILNCDEYPESIEWIKSLLIKTTM